MKRKLLTTALVLAMGLFVFSQIRHTGKRTYKTVKIGKQEWMAENLHESHFRNGDTIHEARTNEQWLKADKDNVPAWCYYDNDPENGKIYGKLYNVHAVFDPRGLAPDGWHIPTDEEWEELANYFGGRNIAGGFLKETGTAHWRAPNKGTADSLGFKALPSGQRAGNTKAAFEQLGEQCIFWTSTRDRISTEVRKLSYMNTRLGGFGFDGGFSVRCIKNK